MAIGHELVDYTGHLLGGPRAEKCIPVTPLTELDRWIEDRQEDEVVFRGPGRADPFQRLKAGGRNRPGGVQ